MMNNESQLLDNEAINRTLNQKKMEHPDASSIYTRGLLSIVFNLISVLLGLIFVKQCFDLAREAEKSIAANPDKYLESSIKKIKTGKMMGYIGLGIFLAEIILLVGFMSIAG